MSAPIRSAGLVILLLGIGLAALALADGAWKSVTGYRSPYRSGVVLPAGEALSERVLLIVLDGVTVEAVDRMPVVQALRRRGAVGELTTVMPSLSRPARATFATGAIPEVHGVMTNGPHEPPPIPSLFSLAAEHGVHTAVAGDSSWARGFPDMIGALQEFDKELETSTGRDNSLILRWQRDICDSSVPFLSRFDSGLLVAGVTAPDAAGHDFGGRSELFLEVVEEADACVARLVEALDDGRTTFMVVSDHGHIDRRGQGGHGGAEPEVRLTPLVMAGPGIRPRDGFEGSHTDIAPTLAALLGLPLPALAAGRPMEPLLELTARQQADLATRVDQQQRLVTQLLPDPAEAAARERRERLPTAIALGLLFVGFGGLAWMRLDAPTGRKLIAVASFVVVYAGFFWLFGLGYSLSAVVKEEYLNNFFLRNFGAAVVGFAAAALWARRSLLWLGLLLQCLLLLRVTWAYGDSGLFLQTYLPDLDVSFRTYLDLLAIFAVGLAACIGAAIRRLTTRPVRS